MSDMQVVGLSDSAERRNRSNAVVETSVVEEVSPHSYVEPPSTVQVTLAKRIMLAGSNKVLCLGAQTSVPINNDELASVSDLAVRLSDGTNVALSLSFFNDNIGMGTIIPPKDPRLQDLSLSRVPFEPTRYADKDGPRLGFVLVSMLASAVTILYFIYPQTFNNVFRACAEFKLTSLSKPASIANPKPVKTEMAAPKISSPKAAVQRPLEQPKVVHPQSEISNHQALRSPQPRTSNRTFTHTARVKENATPSHVAKVTVHSNPSQKSMFIPPPPPTDYAMPPANSPYWMMSPFAQTQAPVQAKPAAQAQAKPEVQKVDAVAQTKASPTKPVQAKAVQKVEQEQGRSVQAIDLKFANPLPAAEAGKMPAPPGGDMAAKTRSMTRSENFSVPAAKTADPYRDTEVTIHGRAPLPGQDDEYTQFERIVPPGQ